MSKEKIYPTMVIRSQAEAIELLEKENNQLKEIIEKVKGENKSLKTRIKTIKRRRKHQTSLIRKFKEEITKKNNALHNKNEVIEEVKEFIITTTNRNKELNCTGLLAENQVKDLLQILDKVKE